MQPPGRPAHTSVTNNKNPTKGLNISMAELVFDESQLDVVGDWFQDSSSSKKHKGSRYFASESSSGSQSANANPGVSKAGLGFDTIKSVKRDDNLSKRGKANTSVPALVKETKANTKGEKKGRKTHSKHDHNDIDKESGNDNDSDNDADDDDDELHGIVEDLSASRTSMPKTKGDKRKQSSKAAPKQDQKKKQKRDKIESTTGNTSKKESSSVIIPEVGDEEKMPSNGSTDKVEGEKTDTQKEKERKKGYWANFRAEPFQVVDGQVVPRKKKKTRSKQKNIRKDNRPLNQRPSYRPLTEATKQRKESGGN